MVDTSTQTTAVIKAMTKRFGGNITNSFPVFVVQSNPNKTSVLRNIRKYGSPLSSSGVKTDSITNGYNEYHEDHEGHEVSCE